MQLHLWFIFFTLIGACIGSFLNVVIYRLPAGKSLNHPPSTCPHCNNRLAWYDNIPVLAWFYLRGKCRQCKVPISFQYPLIEAFTALLFGGWFWLCYYTERQAGFNLPGFINTWPIYICYMVMFAGLLASTLIDARYYIIPLGITWLIALVAVVVLPLTAWLLPGSVVYQTVEKSAANPIEYIIEISAYPIAGAGGIGLGLGGLIGLGIALLLIRLNILPRSFSQEEEAEIGDGGLVSNPDANRQAFMLFGPFVGMMIAGVVADSPARAMARPFDYLIWLFVGMAVGYIVMLILNVVVGKIKGVIEGKSSSSGMSMNSTASSGTGKSSSKTQKDQKSEPPEPFAPYPHVRREAMKEMLFVAVPVIGAVVGWWVMRYLSGNDPAAISQWLRVLGGVGLGYLAGGGVVWMTRILGTLGFGKEAMGLGDVHLMAAVGAVAGWEVAVLAFFLAPFMGIGQAIVSVGLGSVFKRRFVQIPYGPHLAVATLILCIFREPLFSRFSVLLGG